MQDKFYTAVLLEKLNDIEDIILNKNINKWLTIKDASKYSTLSVTRIRKAINNKELQVSKKGGKLLFRYEWIDEWLGA